MSTITLNSITSGYNVNKINDNFNTILGSVNTDLVHVTGGQNTMGQDLDLNSNKLLNVGEVDASLIKLNGQPITTSQFVLGNNVVGDSNISLSGISASKINFLQDGAGAVTRTQLNKSKERHTPFDYGAIGDGVTDDTSALNSFFAYCAANNVIDANATGTFATSATIFIGPASGSSVTLRYSGYMKLVALSAMEQMVVIRNCNYGRWEGGIYCVGTGGSTLASRTCGSGLTITSSLRFQMARSYFQYFNYAGIVAVDATNKSLSDLGNVQAYDIGSGVPNATIAGATLSANWGTRVDTGSSGSNAQTSTIVVDALPPANVTGSTYLSVGAKALMVRIAGTLHYVTAINAGTNVITLFPWIDTSLTSGTLEYVWGGGIVLSGGDTSVLNIGQADCQRCGIGMSIGSLYSPIVKRLVTQYCGTAIAFGNGPSNSCLGGDITGAYFEQNSEQIAFITRSTASSYGSLSSEYGLDLSKVQVVGTPRNADNSRATLAGGLLFFRLSLQGSILQYEKQARNQTDLGTITFAIDRSDKRLVVQGNTRTINLAAMNTDLNRLFGYDSGRVVVWGSGTGDAPTGTITFAPPSGATVNGTTTVAFNGFNGPARFSIYWTAATNDFRVSREDADAVGRATASWTPGTIANGAKASKSVAVTNAALGNFANASFSLGLQGCTIASNVDAAGSTVTTITNNTGASVTLGAGTLSVKVTS